MHTALIGCVGESDDDYDAGPNAGPMINGSVTPFIIRTVLELNACVRAALLESTGFLAGSRGDNDNRWPATTLTSLRRPRGRGQQRHPLAGSGFSPAIWTAMWRFFYNLCSVYVISDVCVIEGYMRTNGL